MKIPEFHKILAIMTKKNKNQFRYRTVGIIFALFTFSIVTKINIKIRRFGKMRLH